MNDTAEAAMQELGELAELWLERHVLRHDNVQVGRAIRQVDKESRKLQRKESRR